MCSQPAHVNFFTAFAINVNHYNTKRRVPRINGFARVQRKYLRERNGPWAVIETTIYRELLN